MTNFKDLQKLFFLLVMGFSMCAFVACSDDEDEGSGSGTPSASVGEVVPGSGKKLLSAGEYKFFYTADGKIKTIELGNYERYEFTYSPNQIIYDYGYDGDGEDEEVYTVSYNEKGYISKMIFTEKGSDEYGSWDDSSTSTLSYDSEGHLVKVTSTYLEQGVEDGESYKESGTGTVVLTWTNGLLTKYEAINEWEDGSEKSTIIFEYEDGKNYNRYKQFAIMDDCQFYLGLYGKGPDYLPVSATETWIEEYDDYKYSDTDTESFTWEFNEDGTLHRANYDYFTYGTIEEQGEIESYQAKASRAEKPRKKGYVFGLRPKKHRK